MKFEWNAEKARSNLAKHGLSFELACEVFEDPDILFGQDRIVDGEERWRAIGRVGFVTIVFVAYAERRIDGEVIVRLISARRADRYERRSYEAGDGDAFR